MWSVGVALEGMQGQITDRAVPILQQIITKLEEGHTLLAQYNKKWKMKAMYDAKDELVCALTSPGNISPRVFRKHCKYVSGMPALNVKLCVCSKRSTGYRSTS